MIGLKDGMVMQRNGQNVCEITVQTDVKLSSVSYIGSSVGSADVLPVGEDRYFITGIPVGGPYTVMAGEAVFSDIYVGDVWILAGQSNMEGVGWLSSEDKEFQGDPTVRALFMEDEWRPAKHPLHTPWKAVDKVHTEVIGSAPPPGVCRGVGPGLAFGLKMKELSGVPQGLLCCAHGGTTMEQWTPSTKHLGGGKSLYGAMLRRFHANGAHIRGMFWFQGCSEAFCRTNDRFTETMKAFFQECRQDMGGEFPVVQVQISRVVSVDQNELTAYWNDIQDQQRRLGDSVPKLYTIASLHGSMDDMIHLSGHTQQQLGEQAAGCMYHLLHGENEKGCLPPPAYKGYRVSDDGQTGSVQIEITYDNLIGELQSKGRPSGFSLNMAKDKLTNPIIFDIQLHGHTVLLRVAKRACEMQGYSLYYGFGINPYCNITDSMGRSIPGMGPIPVVIPEVLIK